METLPLDRRWNDHQMKMTVIWRHIGLVDWRGMAKKSNPNLRLEWRWNDQTTSEWHQMMSNDGLRCVRHSWQSTVVSSFHFFSVFSWITRKDRNCTRKTDWSGKKWTEVPPGPGAWCKDSWFKTIFSYFVYQEESSQTQITCYLLSTSFKSGQVRN